MVPEITADNEDPKVVVFSHAHSRYIPPRWEEYAVGELLRRGHLPPGVRVTYGPGRRRIINIPRSGGMRKGNTKRFQRFADSICLTLTTMLEIVQASNTLEKALISLRNKFEDKFEDESE